jgi:ABC-2 type transport system permease protein
VAGASTIARRAFADARVRTISFALLFFVAALTQATAYREGYPTLAERLTFARTVGANDAARLLYGAPHDLLSVGGYVSWRVGGSLAVFAALFGLLGAVRAMRAEEDAGRAELVLAGVVGRRTAFLALLAAIGVGAGVLWLALFVSFLAGDLPAGGSAYLALAIVSVVPVFAGVGALTSQLAPTKRMATGLATGVLVLGFVLRTLAAISSTRLDWLRWATPLGWAEELRPFADPQPLVLLLPAVFTTLLLVGAARISARRDVGAGLLPAHDTAEPNMRLLSSPTALAVRTLRGGFVAWLAGIAAYALILGVVSDSVAGGLSDNLQEQLEKLGAAGADTPNGFLGFAFLFFLLAISLFGAFQLGAVREEESEQRLETLLAQPVGRKRWLAERLALITVGATVVALSAGVLAWLGAVSAGADVSFTRLLEAGANCLPVFVLFLGLGALAYALVPRAGVAIAYGLVAAAFVWETVGGLLEAPGWLLGISPFHHVALVPAESFAAPAAAVMLALGLAAVLAALAAFRRRDLIGT